MTPQELANLARLRRARDLIDRDYAKPLDVPAMAATALMSPAHFSRQFRAAYGESPYNYLMTRRIERAMALLRTGASVTDACMEVGATSLGSFSSRFTEIVGEPPSAYRDREHAAVNAMPSCVSSDVGSDGHRWVTLGSAIQPDLELVLSLPHAGRSKDDGDALQRLLVKGVLPVVVFRTDDLDATFEAVRAAGAEVLQEPVVQPWGPRDCAFRDPSGNMVRFNQR